MNKKGLAWDNIANMLIVIVIILIVVFMLRGTIIKGVARQTDCVKNQGYCSPVCGPGYYPMAKYACAEIEEICCFDELALKGEKLEEIEEKTPEELAKLSCDTVQTDINEAYKIIWQSMAVNNPETEICRAEGGDNYYAVSPCETQFDVDCDYTGRTKDCQKLTTLIVRRGDSRDLCVEPTNS